VFVSGLGVTFAEYNSIYWAAAQNRVAGLDEMAVGYAVQTYLFELEDLG
jgi:hypothetical protein